MSRWFQEAGGPSSGTSPRTTKYLTVQHQGAMLDAAFSPDGKRLATASTDRQAHVWDIRYRQGG
ncbi:MAG: WD40 repeat domain-containing protein [Deltaproteobacteria bacterium]|nr:WD40 repeat domain-containing protein [Deltaproteobacteria bacterium]